MTVEELAAEVLKLSVEDRKKFRDIVADSLEKRLCPFCWSNDGTWCCQDPIDW